MTDINVVLEEGLSVDISSLTPTERELFFEKLSHTILTKPAADSFVQLYANIASNAAIVQKQTIKELMIRGLIMLDDTVSVRLITIRKPKQGSGGVNVRYDESVRVVDESGFEYISAPNEEIRVTGFIISPPCNGPHTMAQKGKLKRSFGRLMRLNANKLIGGYFTSLELHRDCDDLVGAPLKAIKLGSTFQGEPVRFALTDDMVQLNSLLSYLIALRNYATNEQLIVAYDRIGSALKAGAGTLGGILGKRITPLKTSVHPNENLGNFVDSLDILRKARSTQATLSYDLRLAGLSAVYDNSVIHGETSSEVTKLLDELRAQNKRQEFKVSYTAAVASERAKASRIRYIIRAKLDKARVRELDSRIDRARKSSKILELLKPAERRLVELEIETQDKYARSAAMNKCAHVKLYARFRGARDTRTIESTFRELRALFENPTEKESFIMCSVCKFEIMCPHVFLFTELSLGGAMYSEVKEKLAGYIDRAAARDSYYCRICGELIGAFDRYDGAALDHGDQMDEELKKYIWSEVAFLTKYLLFNQMVDVPKLITAVRDEIYSFVYETERRILASNTSNSEETKAKKRLYTTIYAVASFIKIIDIDSRVSFREHKGQTKNALVGLIKHGIDIIVSSRNISIRAITGMTSDVIKNALVEAYKAVRSLKKTNEQRRADKPQDSLVYLLLDPIFRYIYRASVLADCSRGGKLPKIGSSMSDRVDDLLGGPMQMLKKQHSLYDNIKAISFEASGGRATSVTRWQNYASASYVHFVKKINDKLHEKRVYVDAAVTKDEIKSKLSPEHQKYMDEYNELAKQEKEVMRERAESGLQSFSVARVVNTRDWTRPTTSLARRYDEQGRRHKWDILVFDSGTDQPMKEYLRLLEKGDPVERDITDYKCSVCGVKRSECDKISESAVIDILSSKRSIGNFFRFYENRCPSAPLHEFNESDQCVHCALNRSMLTNVNTAEALQFFKKYFHRYTEDKLALEQKVEVQQPPQATLASQDIVWNYNYNVVTKLAEEINVSPKLLESMGATEQQDYAHVQSGAYIAGETKEPYGTRIFTLDAYMRMFIVEYNKLRNMQDAHKPDQTLIELLDKSNTPGHIRTSLASRLTPVATDYNGQFKLMRISIKPREMVEFCIQSICEAALAILALQDKETSAARRAFVEYAIGRILRADELLTKSERFNWTALYGEKPETIVDTNVNKDREDIENDDEKPDDGSGDTASPLSGNDFDMEEDMNDDPEAEKNEIRVGEDLGMT